MSRFITLFFVALISSTLFISQAEAKRFGGAKSFGYQRQNISQPAAPKAAQAPAAPASAAPPSPASRWLGPLAGLAAGGLLASLFMGHGFEGINFFDIILIMGLAALMFFVIRALRRPQPALSLDQVQYAGHGASVTDTYHDNSTSFNASDNVHSRPAWFNEEAFTRLAKGHFIRLQAANDEKNLHDIREYTTPEVFAEISLQIQERGDAPQHTDVVSVDAKVLNVTTEGDLAIASVRFTGRIREQDNGPIESFDEIWHVQRSLSQANANWYIAGIQQTPLAMELSG